ncbi:MAG TPA: exodeoxyribonuclease VII small subunit [Pirellulaceae bacterium]|nr:exodeoxyribonuclease VII small subunit [Pirellulaceae bacterium]
MSRKKREPTPDEPVSFEVAFARLQDLVKDLESGRLSLDQSLECYAQAVAHLRTCAASLEQAEQKIRLLVDVDEQGRAITQHFGHQASTHRSSWDHDASNLDDHDDEFADDGMKDEL